MTSRPALRSLAHTAVRPALRRVGREHLGISHLCRPLAVVTFVPCAWDTPRDPVGMVGGLRCFSSRESDPTDADVAHAESVPGGYRRKARLSHNQGNFRKVDIATVTPNGDCTEGISDMHSLMRDTGLHPRDLSVVLDQRDTVPPRILPRPAGIVITLFHVRGVILPDRFVLVRSRAARRKSSLIPVIVDSIAEANTSGFLLPFELMCLECCLSEAIEKYSRRVEFCRPLVDDLVRQLGSVELDDEALYRLHPIKQSLRGIHLETGNMQDMLKTLIETPRDVRDLCITLPPDNDDEDGKKDADDSALDMEIMLEAYLTRLTEVHQNAGTLLEALQSKQSVMRMQMSNYRNHLMHLNLRLTVAAVAVGFGTFGAGLFGMNLVSNLENVQGLFWGVSAGCGSVGILFYLATLYRVKRSSPKRQHMDRVMVVQDFIRRLDTKMASARSTLSHAYNTESIMADGITREEFRQLHEKLVGRPVSTEEVELIFQLLDSDSDGLLEDEEVLHLLDGQRDYDTKLIFSQSR